VDWWRDLKRIWNHHHHQGWPARARVIMQYNYVCICIRSVCSGKKGQGRTQEGTHKRDLVVPATTVNRRPETEKELWVGMHQHCHGNKGRPSPYVTFYSLSCSRSNLVTVVCFLSYMKFCITICAYISPSWVNQWWIPFSSTQHPDMNPRSRLVLNIFQSLLISWSAAFGLWTLLSPTMRLCLRFFLSFPSIIVFFLARKRYESYSLRRHASRLGVHEIPKVRGKWPGNLDILFMLMSQIRSGAYLMEPLRELMKKYDCNTLNLYFLWTDFVRVHFFNVFFIFVIIFGR